MHAGKYRPEKTPHLNTFDLVKNINYRRFQKIKYHSGKSLLPDKENTWMKKEIATGNLREIAKII